MIVLRKAGIRLRRPDWPPPLRRRMAISAMDGAHNFFKRHVRIVELWDCHPTRKRSLLFPMFDPVILKTVEGGFLL